MVRRTGNSRVSGSDSGSGPQQYEPKEFPSLRSRRPVMFWVVVLAVAAMVLSTIASFVTAFA